MARALLERRQFAHECSLSQVLVRPYEARLVAGYSATLLVAFMNRRMRNRTSGGVGGRREQTRLLPDLRRLTAKTQSLAGQGRLDAARTFLDDDVGLWTTGRI